MDAEYYSNARKWYNTMYVDCASERIVYFVLLIVSLISVFFAYDLIDIISKQKAKVETYVLLMEHKDADSIVQAYQLPEAQDSTLSLLEFVVRKYITNYEQLKYDSNEISGTDALQEKTIIIRNLSGNDVYNNYMTSAYASEDSDMSLALLKQQRVVNIEKVEFLYDNLNILEKVYNSLSSNITPHNAKVYFSTETTSENSIKKNYVANIGFSFYIDKEKKANSKVEFKVNSYYKELIE